MVIPPRSSRLEKYFCAYRTASTRCSEHYQYQNIQLIVWLFHNNQHVNNDQQAYDPYVYVSIVQWLDHQFHLLLLLAIDPIVVDYSGLFFQ
ncbi:hypothetical protein DERP_011629 [Dermatophagoides pteronyssinus]|uniref:Uncharacterized protein n=1 Tax=Dermatophagoides pteronyssinus TaxID=6956 RepID=A0ABQ8JWU1_DERPT|nr:hypothetical protein DERP_011629 [Dermatophagoides pteronyssinus]